MDQKHILVIRMSAMGDVAMTIPVIKTLLAQNPNLKITVVSKGFLKPLFEDIEKVNFFTADVEGKHKGLKGIYKLYKELKRFHFDAIADLHDVLRSKILRNFFKIKGVKIASINKGRAEKKALTALANKTFKQLKTTHQRYADVFEELGFTVDLSKPVLKPKREEIESLKNRISVSKNEKIIGIAPFAAHQGKKYPLNLMKQVVAELSLTYKVYLFGGGNVEVEQLTKLANTFDNVECLAGQLKLKEELAVISNLSLMISMDSGNGHFSALYGVPTITIWGATHPYAGFVPFGQQENCLVANREKYPLLPTSIYGNKIVSGYENVMETISPEMIINKALNILK